jgi:hypothetical protein
MRVRLPPAPQRTDPSGFQNPKGLFISPSLRYHPPENLLATGGGGRIEAFLRREQIPNRAARLGERDRGANHRDLWCTGWRRQRTEGELAADYRRRIGKAVRRKRPVDRAVKAKESSTRNGSTAGHGEPNSNTAGIGIITIQQGVGGCGAGRGDRCGTRPGGCCRRARGARRWGRGRWCRGRRAGCTRSRGSGNIGRSWCCDNNNHECSRGRRQRLGRSLTANQEQQGKNSGQDHLLAHEAQYTIAGGVWQLGDPAPPIVVVLLSPLEGRLVHD